MLCNDFKLRFNFLRVPDFNPKHFPISSSNKGEAVEEFEIKKRVRVLEKKNEFEVASVASGRDLIDPEASVERSHSEVRLVLHPFDVGDRIFGQVLVAFWEDALRLDGFIHGGCVICLLMHFLFSLSL